MNLPHWSQVRTNKKKLIKIMKLLSYNVHNVVLARLGSSFKNGLARI